MSNNDILSQHLDKQIIDKLDLCPNLTHYVIIDDVYLNEDDVPEINDDDFKVFKTRLLK
jgi:hypothetical protein